MATTPHSSLATRAVVLVALLAAAAIMPASASTLTVFEGSGCQRGSKVIAGCGCFDLENYKGGYRFVYTNGQRAELKASSTCVTRESPKILQTDTSSCVPFEYRGVNLIC